VSLDFLSSSLPAYIPYFWPSSCEKPSQLSRRRPLTSPSHCVRLRFADANDSAIRGEISIIQLRDQPTPDDYLIKQREVALDKELLQLVQGACKADNLQRALDLTRLMHNPGSVDAAAKIAGFYHLPGLQERMGGVVVKKKVKREYHPLIGNVSNGNGSGSGERSGGGEKSGKGFNDFAPRNNRRSFGGKVRDRDSTPATNTASATANGNGTYIPETPRTEMESTPAIEESVMGSPEGEFKRKREEEEFAPRKVESSFKGVSLSPSPRSLVPLVSLVWQSILIWG
jgi:chromosome transmission fidelity protein 4